MRNESKRLAEAELELKREKERQKVRNLRKNFKALKKSLRW